MITRKLKLKLNKKQKVKLDEWLWHLTGVYNWAIRKIELDAKDRIYHSKFSLQNILPNHCKKLNVSSHSLQGILANAHTTWQRCFKKISKKPRLKGKHNKLKSIPFPDPIKPPKNNKIKLPLLGEIRYFKQDIPEGKIKCAGLIKKASGWYLCIIIDASANKIPIIGNNIVGIDPGFNNLLTISSGEKIEHPHELKKAEKRLAQAQRGRRKQLTARIHERIANKRLDRNHKLSRRLISENAAIYFSKDNIKGIAKKFGKSVTSSSHGQLRQMLSYKSALTGGRKYVEVDSKFSTKACSNCGSLTGPTGWGGLKIRQWTCVDCGKSHDRDVNAAINTLIVGAGISLRDTCERSSELVGVS